MFNCEKTLDEILVPVASGIYTQHPSPVREKKKAKYQNGCLNPKWKV